MTVLGHELGGEICTALGLDAHKITDIDIYIHTGCAVTVAVNYLPLKEDLEKLIPIMAKYELKPREITLANKEA